MRPRDEARACLRCRAVALSGGVWLFVFITGALFAQGRADSERRRSEVTEGTDGRIPAHVVRSGDEGLEVIRQHCLECHHGGDPAGGLDLSTREAALRGGESGTALDPDASQESLLWERVADDEMPPEQPLSAEAKQALRQWLRTGAAWPPEPLDPFAQTTAKRAGRDWWSWQALQAVAVPQVEQDNWSRNEIDRFVLSRLRENGLLPAPEADPRTKVRRLYFDLIGLPPPAEVVAAFVNDPSPTAWQDLVERLLASPQYGEHWASHWLDVARFGESHGFEYNQPRAGAWFYRDWVIEALNRDLPYPQFVEAQIAGDVLQGETVAGLAPLGFLVAGPHNTVLGISEVMRETARQEELEEIAGTLGQAFLGLTVNCARCHDHKFDPISSREYYRFIASLAGVGHGNRTASAALSSTERQHLDAERAEYQRRLARVWAERGERLSVSENRLKTDLPDEANQAGKKYQLKLRIGPTVWANASQATKDSERLELRLSRRDGGTAGKGTFTAGDWEQLGESQVFSEVELTYVGDGTGPLTLQLQAAENTSRFAAAIDWIVCLAEGGAVLWREDFRPVAPDPAPGVQASTGLPVHCRLRFENWQTEGLNAAHAVEFQPGEFAVQVYSGTADAVVTPKTDEERAWARELQSIEQKLGGANLFTVVPRAPGVIRLLHRGDVRQAGETLAPGGIGLVSDLDSEWGLGASATDAERRVALARWITAPENSLFHRVAVNRVWHYHFGAGLLEKTSDFGFNGGRPSHPELLEWLAVWFRDQGYSLKQLHRLIVTSATWQQSSLVAEHPQAKRGLAADRGNRLLWKQNPRRLSAEMLRDSLLSIAGVLDSRLGGEGYADFAIDRIGDAHYYRHVGELSPDRWRRSIYRFRVRGDRSPLLEAFDCPDPSAATPTRNSDSGVEFME